MLAGFSTQRKVVLLAAVRVVLLAAVRVVLLAAVRVVLLAVVWAAVWVGVQALMVRLPLLRPGRPRCRRPRRFRAR